MRKQSPSRITEDQFKQIKELKEQGLLTSEEFEFQKAKLLN